jgi:hypothetical protein
MSFVYSWTCSFSIVFSFLLSTFTVYTLVVFGGRFFIFCLYLDHGEIKSSSTFGRFCLFLSFSSVWLHMETIPKAVEGSGGSGYGSGYQNLKKGRQMYRGG